MNAIITPTAFDDECNIEVEEEDIEADIILDMNIIDKEREDLVNDEKDTNLDWSTCHLYL